MNRCIGMLSLILGVSFFSTQAADFTDDFTRADVASTTNGALIGSGYVISASTGEGRFQITDGGLTLGGGDGLHEVLSYQGFETLNAGTGESFAVAVDIRFGVVNAGISSGLALNFQDADNFYFARLSTGSSAGSGSLQIGQIVNGTASSFGSETGLNIQTGTVYRLTVFSDKEGVFTYSIAGSTVSVSNSVTDTNVDFLDGYAGVYQNNGNTNTRFDNFEVSVTEPPPPSYPAGFSDNFARDDVAPTSDGAQIGGDYTVSTVTGTATLQIRDEQLAFSGGNGSHCVLIYQGFETLNSSTGFSFSAGVDIEFGVVNNGISSGITFNWQDAGNFYFARLSTGTSTGAGYLQIGQVVNGSVGTLGSVNSLNIETGTVYRLTVESDEAGSFTYSVAGGSVVLTNSATDTNVDFSDGYAGIYQNNANSNTAFDNFSVNADDGSGSATAQILSFASADGSRMALTVYTDSPSGFLPEYRDDLVSGSWIHVPHADSVSGTLVVTNLEYAEISGSNRVIYVSSDAETRFFQIRGN